MAGYDPKQKRAHSPAAADAPAPVDDLLGPPPTPVADPDAAPETLGPEVAQEPTPLATAVSVPGPRRPLIPTPPPAPGGPPPRAVALAAAALVALLVWRWRRR